MTILATIRTEKDVGTPTFIHVGGDTAHGAVVRTAVTWLKVLGIFGGTGRVLFVAYRARELRLFLCACIAYSDE